MKSLIDRAMKYLLAERDKCGYYTDSVEVLDIVEDLIIESREQQSLLEEIFKDITKDNRLSPDTLVEVLK